MYVLMDMEWFEYRQMKFITQIAAIRVDCNLNVIDNFFTRIRPDKSYAGNFSHISFNGGTEKQFRNAPNTSTAFLMLSRWFMDDDYVFWWHESSENYFRDEYKNYATNMPKTAVLRVAVKKQLTDKMPKSGMPHKLCEARGIPVKYPEHNSENDVYAMLYLLEYVNLPMSSYVNLQCTLNLVYSETDRAKTYGKTVEKRWETSGVKIIFDTTANIVHNRSCPNCKELPKPLKEVSLKDCVEQNLKPHSCCRKSIENYRSEMINPYFAMPVIYSTKSGSNIVHYPHCALIKKVNPEHRQQFPSLEEAEVNGYRACKHCSSIKRFYYQDAEEIQTFCKNQGITCVLEGNMLYITSKLDRWRIILDKKSGYPALYHRNKEVRRDEVPSPVTGFHRQETTYTSILGMLKDIVSHDQYKSSLRKSCSKKKIHGTHMTKATKKLLKNEKRRMQAEMIEETLEALGI